MTATDELRALLDERGIEYYAMPSINGMNYFFGWVDECGGYTKCVGVQGDCYYARWEHLTPAQAIEVTLWRGTCKRLWTGSEMICSECAHQLNDPTANFCPSCGREVVDG